MLSRAGPPSSVAESGSMLRLVLALLLAAFALAVGASPSRPAVGRSAERRAAEDRVATKLALLQLDPLEGLEEPAFKGGKPNGCMLIFNVLMGRCAVSPPG